MDKPFFISLNGISTMKIVDKNKTSLNGFDNILDYISLFIAIILHKNDSKEAGFLYPVSCIQ